MTSGRCHCGAVTWTATGEPLHHALCHCSDCRRSAGAPMVGWIAYKAEQVTIDGEVTTFNSSGTAMRQFCPKCGTGMFYTNAEYLPGIIDIQSSTLDDAGEHAPAAHIQVAERLPWMATQDALPKFDRFPSMD
ncbi:MAG: GFA family protein [Pseudomonadota bacterium]